VNSGNRFRSKCGNTQFIVHFGFREERGIKSLIPLSVRVRFLEALFHKLRQDDVILFNATFGLRVNVTLCPDVLSLNSGWIYSFWNNVTCIYLERLSVYG
jgi:hypothetical protein